MAAQRKQQNDAMRVAEMEGLCGIWGDADGERH